MAQPQQTNRQRTGPVRGSGRHCRPGRVRRVRVGGRAREAPDTRDLGRILAGLAIAELERRHQAEQAAETAEGATGAADA